MPGSWKSSIRSGIAFVSINPWPESSDERPKITPRLMFLDTIHGIIDRRVLLNYRIDPEVLQRVLPPVFQPKLYNGHAVGGVCMIRFKELRPRFVPSWLGLGSENAAHRIAVQWKQDG